MGDSQSRASISRRRRSPTDAIGLVAGLAILLAAPAADAEHARCRLSPHIIAPCFTVHGLLSVWNGTPSLRISRMGNRRVLGVVGGDRDARAGDRDGDSPPILPPSLESAIRPTTAGQFTSVYGDFRVCPLTWERPGHMRFVCIDRAAHVFRAEGE